MAATGYTPISLYYSTTASAAPTAGNLVNGELAINITDGKLYYKDNTGTVKVIAGTGGAGIAAGSNTQIQFNSSGSLGASSNLTWNGSTLAVTGAITATADSAFTSTGAVQLPSGTTGEQPTGVAGKIRFNTTTGSFEGYNGTIWGAIGGAPTGAYTRTDVTATAGQTTFTGLSYQVGYIQVYLNGVLLDTTDYTASSGTSVVLGSAAAAGDIVSFVVLTISSVGNASNISGGAANQIPYQTAPSTTAFSSNLQFDGNNLGLGVTPASSDTTLKYLSIGNTGNSFAGFSGATTSYILAGAVYNAGWKYAVSSSAVSRYDIGAGTHTWFNASSGTAGNAITFTQAMTLDASGNLGIGTTSPSNKLDVFGATRSQVQSGSTNNTAPIAVIVSNKTTGAHAAGLGASLQFSYENSGGGYAGGQISSVGGADPFTADLRFYPRNYGYTEAMRIDSSGNVGIGSTTPTTPIGSGNIGLVIYNSTTNQSKIHLQNSTSGSTSSTGGLFSFDGTDVYLWNYQNGTTRFGTNNAERARIGSDGGFMVGTTTSPGAGLIADVSGNVRSLPLNSQTSAYVPVASDNGKVISITTGGVTINNSVFSAGMVLTIYNNSGSSQTITQGTGVTLQWAGQSSSTTGSRTLGLYGIATVYFLSASSAVISGSGLT